MSLTQEQDKTFPRQPTTHLSYPSSYNPRIPHNTAPLVLLKGKSQGKIIVFSNSIRTLYLLFSVWPVNCEPDFHFGFDTVHMSGQRSPSGQVVRYDNNRVPLTEITALLLSPH